MPPFRAALLSPIVRISINLPCVEYKNTGKNIRAGQFQDMLGIGEGRRGERENNYLQ